MFDFLRPKYYYVQLRTNELKVKNIQTGKSVTRTALKPFSNSRLIIADFLEAENLLKSMIQEIEPESLFPVQISMLVHVIEQIPDGVSEVEKRVLRDFAEMSGARKIRISEYPSEFSDKQVIDAFKSVNWTYGYS